MTVQGLTVASPFEAFENLLQADQLVADLDPAPLLEKKLVIDRLAATGLRFGTPRATDGRTGKTSDGVIGQVTRAHLMLAEVTLITDKDQRTPVEVLRNGLRAIVYGGGNQGTLELSYMTTNADIQAGDMLVTSGIDATYPPGLPVARVSRVERDAAYSFAKIICVPTAGPDRNRQVLVLAQDNALPSLSTETDAPAAKARALKRARKRQ